MVKGISANVFFMFTAGGVDYQSEVYSVTVEAEETSAEVSIAIFNETIF